MGKRKEKEIAAESECSGLKGALKNALWAKSEPYESFYAHSEKTAAVMEALKVPMRKKFELVASGLGIGFDEAVRFLSYIAAVHDIGKMIPIWQAQPGSPAERFFTEHPALINEDEFSIEDRYRHERGGYEILMRIWGENEVFANRRQRVNIASVIITHHQPEGVFRWEPFGTTSEKCGRECPPEWIALQREFELSCRKRYGIDDIALSVQGGYDVPCTNMSTLLIFADWMASSLGSVPYCTKEDKARFKETVGIYLADMNLTMKNNLPDNFHDMWPWITEMRPMQKAVEEMSSKFSPMLTIIEDSMGSGKTEAALFLAAKLAKKMDRNGIYVALPTEATANQMHSRVDELLERFDMHGSRLLHGASWLINGKNDAEENYAERFLAPARMGLFAPFGVGTIDQVLLSVLRNRYWNLRLSALSEKVLILDEVHSYDAYMSAEIQTLLCWCKAMGVPVIMLSATLSEKKRREFLSIYSDTEPKALGYPRLSCVDQNGTLTEETVRISEGSSKKYGIEFEPILHDISAIADLALAKVKRGGNLCVTVNTVQRAKDVAQAISEKASDQELHLFHANYTTAMKREIERTCIRIYGKDGSERPACSILVATQVVEQSLDLDFDYYISDICPIDLQLQRLGRLFRHERKSRPCKSPQFTVLVPEDRKAGYAPSDVIYPTFLLQKTEEILTGRDSIVLPDDIPTLVEQVYSAEDISNSFVQMKMDEVIKAGTAEEDLIEQPGKNFQLGKIIRRCETLNENKKTRLSKESVRAAIIPHRLYEKEKDKTTRLTLEEQMEIYEYSFKILKERYDFSDVLQGEQMLSGMFLLDGGDELSSPLQSSSSEGLIMDSMYGLSVRRK